MDARMKYQKSGKKKVATDKITGENGIICYLRKERLVTKARIKDT